MKVITTGYTDTPIEGVDKLSLDRGLLNFKEDFRVKSNDNGKEIILTNITSPIDRPENIRIAYNQVSNIYNGTGIEPSMLATSKRGVNILTQLTDILSVVDDTDPDYRVDLPVSCHLVIKAPASEHINSDVILTSVGRLLSSLFATGSNETARLEAILRGSLVPSDL